jgi:hypothetical protein
MILEGEEEGERKTERKREGTRSWECEWSGVPSAARAWRTIVKLEMHFILLLFGLKSIPLSSLPVIPEEKQLLLVHIVWLTTFASLSSLTGVNVRKGNAVGQVSDGITDRLLKKVSTERLKEESEFVELVDFLNIFQQPHPKKNTTQIIKLDFKKPHFHFLSLTVTSFSLRHLFLSQSHHTASCPRRT